MQSSQKRQRQKKSLQRAKRIKRQLYGKYNIKFPFPQMTGQNDRQDESLTGQVQDQAGHCQFTGCYFQPCLRVKNFC